MSRAFSTRAVLPPRGPKLVVWGFKNLVTIVYGPPKFSSTQENLIFHYLISKGGGMGGSSV